MRRFVKVTLLEILPSYSFYYSLFIIYYSLLLFIIHYYYLLFIIIIYYIKVYYNFNEDATIIYLATVNTAQMLLACNEMSSDIIDAQVHVSDVTTIRNQTWV